MSSVEFVASRGVVEGWGTKFSRRKPKLGIRNWKRRWFTLDPGKRPARDTRRDTDLRDTGNLLETAFLTRTPELAHVILLFICVCRSYKCFEVL